MTKGGSLPTDAIVDLTDQGHGGCTKVVMLNISIALRAEKVFEFGQ